MQVALFGGTGFIGHYIARELVAQGMTVRILTRQSRASADPYLHETTLIRGSVLDGGTVETCLAGCEALVYSVGVIREFPGQLTYQEAHVEGVGTVLAAARKLGVRRAVLISAHGVENHHTPYEITKEAGERLVRESDLDWTILRPSLVFGDPHGRMELATQLVRQLIRPRLPLPLFFSGWNPRHAGSFRLTPVQVQDLARIVRWCLETPAESVGRVFPVGGPVACTWRTMLETLSTVTGRKKWAFPVPVGAIRPLVWLLGRFSWFPLTLDQLRMLVRGNTCYDPDLYLRAGFQPRPWDESTLGYLRSPGMPPGT
ncbi:MAG: NAD-dependent epimerase/dehydratase family protein [Candidatus Neomarinimicrobiota bacterium]|nr:MAG: NAD-dependent epimerase/dehydratase family protein [Candidatus Neomarinimicrobiota bacterium]